MERSKFVRESRTVKSSHVLPSDTNNHHTLFGGNLMAYMDDVASITAMRHSRTLCVTASTDSVDFLRPIKEGSAVCLEAFVSWTHKTSMEVFVKVVAEDLLSGERAVCTTAFLTFVALDEKGKPTPVPHVIPETDVEKWLHESAPERAEARKRRREESKRLAGMLGTGRPWDNPLQTNSDGTL